MTHVTCRLNAKNRDQLRNPTLGNRVWAISFTYLPCMHSPPIVWIAGGIVFSTCPFIRVCVQKADEQFSGQLAVEFEFTYLTLVTYLFTY